VASYYYLVASLPMLRFDDDPPITMERFLESCSQSLGAKDFHLVSELVSDNLSSIAHESGFLAQWDRFNRSLKGTLRVLRAQDLNRTPTEASTDFETDVHVKDIVRQAMQAEHPLEAELMLILFQWRKAEELSQYHAFDREVIFTYAIQLALLERKALFTPMEGLAEFKRLFSNLQSIIKSI